MVRTFFYLTKTYMNMENLKIRITLTNTKGWKETQDVTLSYYESEKENGNNPLDNIVEHLLQDYEKTGKNMNKLKKEDIKWRP